GMLCAVGILLALIERARSGKGQVVDVAMVDGATHLITYFFGLLAHGLMSLDIGTNMLDGGAPYYQTYETRDKKFMAVGAIEARFYELLLQGLGLDPSSLPSQNDDARWLELTARFAEVFRTKTRDEWTAIFEGKDACVAPVLDLHEVGLHAHNRARGLITALDGVDQPAPAPRLSRTPGEATKGGTPRGAETREVLEQLGYGPDEVEEFYGKSIVE
ncbi:MAG TPA: CoA transferase, partial [Conexivisphaerales archaeon]|nr:CoA transferase [Conexivisphaerales archaeon]